MKEKLARFMAGRNGIDQLNLFLLGLDLVLLLAASLFRGSAGLLAYLPVFALLGYSYFRMLSRNTLRRREENGKYLRLRYKLAAAWKIRREKWAQGLQILHLSLLQDHAARTPGQGQAENRLPQVRQLL